MIIQDNVEITVLYPFEYEWFKDGELIIVEDEYEVIYKLGRCQITLKEDGCIEFEKIGEK